MESKLYKKTNKGFKVFPHVFKKIGLGLILASALVTILYITLYRDVIATKEAVHWAGIALIDIFIVGLLFFSLAAEKIEDERVELIRLRTLAGLIVFMVIIVILKPLLFPLLDILFPSGVIGGEEIPILNAQELIIEALFMYNFMFYYLKRKQ